MIDIIEYAFQGGPRYGFEYTPPNGERVRVRMASVEDAESKAREIIGTTQAGRMDLMSIDPDEFAEFLRWKEQRSANALHVPALVDAFLATKENKGRSGWTVMSWKKWLKPFAAQFTGRIEDVTRIRVEKWLELRGIGPRTWNNFLSAFNALARFARKEGHIGSNIIPIETMDRQFHRPKIETYTVGELKALLSEVPVEWRPLIIFGAFAGIRPEEACPDPRSAKPGLEWRNVLWDRHKIDVPAEVAKGTASGRGRRRFVPFNDALDEFLADYRSATGPVCPRRRFSHAKSTWDLSVKWKQDALRHSYASNRLASLKSVHELALEMGNSPTMIYRHYLDLRHEDEAAEWFGVKRTDVWADSEKVTVGNFGHANP